jgi:hypothetical protein
MIMTHMMNMRMMMKRQGHFQKWRKTVDATGTLLDQQPAYNKIINAEVQLHHQDHITTGKVKRRVLGPDGRTAGSYHDSVPHIQLGLNFTSNFIMGPLYIESVLLNFSPYSVEYRDTNSTLTHQRLNTGLI